MAVISVCLWWIVLTSGISVKVVDGTLTLSPNDGTDYILTDSGRAYLVTLSTCSPGISVTFTSRYVSLQDSQRKLYTLYNIRMECRGAGGLSIMQNIKLFAHPLLTGKSFRMEVTTDNPASSVLSAGTITFPANYSLTGSSKYVHLGDQFTWTCRTANVIPPGAAVLAVKWTVESVNTEGVYVGNDIATVGLVNKECMYEGTPNLQYIYNCTSEGNFILTIPAQNLTIEDQFTWWRCHFYTEVNNSIYASPFQQLSIKVPLRELKISPSRMVIEEGTNVTISCRVNNDTNPVPALQWSIDELDLSSSAAVNFNTPYLSILTYTGTRADQNKTIICAAENTTFQAGTTLTVHYPPADGETLDLSLSRQQPLFDGDPNVTVTCRQPGGYPLCNVTLLCQGQNGKNQASDNVIVSVISIPVTKKLNGRFCTCQATHTTGQYHRRKKLHFLIYYAPDTPIIRPSPVFPWKSGNSGTLSCMSGNGFPEENTYEWIEENQIVNTSLAFTFNTLTSDDNNRVTKCSVENAYLIHRGTTLDSKYTTLSVEYNPIMTVDSSDIIRDEGQNVVRNCSAIGNPTPLVTWIHKERSKVMATGQSWSLLNLTNINRADTGNYTCVAVPVSPINQLTNTTRTVSLMVYFSPEAPTGFSATEILSDSVKFHWIKGLDGGYLQSFHIIFKSQIHNDSYSNGSETWNDSDMKIISQSITGLESSTWYSFWLFSQNRLGRSPYASESPILLQTKSSLKESTEKISKEEFSIINHIGEVLSAVLVLLIILIVLYVMRRRKANKGRKVEESSDYDTIGERKENESVYSDLDLTYYRISDGDYTKHDEGEAVYVNTTLFG